MMASRELTSSAHAPLPLKMRAEALGCCTGGDVRLGDGVGVGEGVDVGFGVGLDVGDGLGLGFPAGSDGVVGTKVPDVSPSAVPPGLVPESQPAKAATAE